MRDTEPRKQRLGSGIARMTIEEAASLKPGEPYNPYGILECIHIAWGGIF
jgi:hypothetical protein